MQLGRLSLFRPTITVDQTINNTVNHTAFLDSRGSVTDNKQSITSASSTCTRSQNTPTPTQRFNTDVSPMLTQTSNDTKSTQSSPSILREPKLKWPNVNNVGSPLVGQSELRTGERFLTSTPTNTASGKPRADQPINNKQDNR